MYIATAIGACVHDDSRVQHMHHVHVLNCDGCIWEFNTRFALRSESKMHKASINICALSHFYPAQHVLTLAKTNQSEIDRV